MFGERVGGLRQLKVLCHGSDTLLNHPAFFGFDPGKLVTVTRGTALGGAALLALLRSRYGLELEMAAPEHAVAMTSICDGAEAFGKLAAALLEIDSAVAAAEGGAAAAAPPELPVQALAPGEAEQLCGQALPLQASAGRIALEYVWSFPPGIPFLVPGEVIDGSVIEQIEMLIRSGVNVKSTSGGPAEDNLLRPADLTARTYL